MMTLLRWLWYLLPGNPVLVAIVLGGSRRQRHLWVRTTYLGTLIGLVVIGLLTSGGVTGQVGMTELAQAGTQVFHVISYAQVVLICLLAPMFMAGAIGREKIGGTYDILLTTPLSNLQIVLGVLGGRLFFVWALLASGFPLFAVLLLFGGVPIGAVFVSFAVAGVSALTVGAVAVALSVWRRGGRKSVFVFVITVGALLIASYMLDALLLRRLAPVAGPFNQGTTWLTPLHPLLVLEASLYQATYRPPDPAVLGQYPAWARFYLSRPFAAFTAISVAVSGVLIAFGAVGVRLVDHSQSRQGGREGGRPPGRLLNLRAWFSKHSRSQAGRLEGLKNPVAWREARRNNHSGWWALIKWGFAALAVAGAAALLAAYHTGRLPRLINPQTGGQLQPYEVFRLALLGLLMVELAVVTLVAIYISAGSVSREREEGTLDLLLTTLITPRQYLWGKLQGLVAFLAVLVAVPVITLGMVSVYTLIGSYLEVAPARVPFTLVNAQGMIATIPVPVVVPEAPLLWLAALLPFTALCVAVGLWWSLKTKSVLGAVAPSLGVIACLGVVMGLCGYNAAGTVPLLGTILNAFSPVTSLVTLIDPWQQIAGFGEDPTFGRLSVALGATIAGAGYSAVVYLMLQTMVRDFDHTVRHLTGTA